MNETLTILVIDDNKDDRVLYQRALNDAFSDRVRFIEAASGESGLKSIEKDTPHCVLLDYSLPGHNGIEVLKRIRAIHSHLPVVMLTGQGNEAVAVQSMKEGAQDYIVKDTITPETLQRVVRIAIEHSAMQRNIHEQRASLEIFTRALAHDLKEPVRTIRSFLDQIADWRNLCDHSQKSFHYIRKAADRMNALIDTVYLYTRLDAAEQMEMTFCDISSIMKEVQENLAQLIEERGAIIICDVLPLVHANRMQMIQLFQNLLVNSIRHCESEVTIDVSAEEHEDHWQFSVRDNGPGIETEYIEMIFNPFKRLSHRKEDGAGLGMGLAISRKIVEAHRGKIWCESVIGTGTSFRFTLPKTAITVPMKNAVSDPVLTPDQKAVVVSSLARILLVDDSEDDIMLNRCLLVERTNLRCEVLAARDGKEALAMLKSAIQENNPIDLILLDINMPVMDGFELLSKMQKEYMLPSPMVVMCTTSDYDKDKRIAESFGAAGYLTKPPQFSLFKDIIDHSRNLRLCQEGDDFALCRAI